MIQLKKATCTCQMLQIKHKLIYVVKLIAEESQNRFNLWTDGQRYNLWRTWSKRQMVGKVIERHAGRKRKVNRESTVTCKKEKTDG